MGDEQNEGTEGAGGCIARLPLGENSRGGWGRSLPARGASGVGSVAIVGGR